jgi:Na+/melibiose symporter-like transporter
MVENKNFWQTKASKLGLTISFALFIFSINSLLIGFLFSWLLHYLGYTAWILSQETWKILVVISLLIFTLITFSLYVSENWIHYRIIKIQDSIGKNLLLFLSISLALVILLITYYGFSVFFSFLYNYYWTN